jgi:hypothetical protein
LKRARSRDCFASSMSGSIYTWTASCRSGRKPPGAGTELIQVSPWMGFGCPMCSLISPPRLTPTIAIFPCGRGRVIIASGEWPGDVECSAGHCHSDLLWHPIPHAGSRCIGLRQMRRGSWRTLPVLLLPHPLEISFWVASLSCGNHLTAEMSRP